MKTITLGSEITLTHNLICAGKIWARESQYATVIGIEIVHGLPSYDIILDDGRRTFVDGWEIKSAAKAEGRAE